MVRVKELIAAAARAKDTAPIVWSPAETGFLLKATKIFPPGTVNDVSVGGNRWAQIGEYVKVHARTTWTRKEKDVIVKVRSFGTAP